MKIKLILITISMIFLISLQSFQTIPNFALNPQINDANQDVAFENSFLDSDVATSQIPEKMNTEDYFGNEVVQSTNIPNSQTIEKVESKSADSYYEDLVVNIDTDKKVYLPGETVNFEIQATQQFLPVSKSVTIKIYRGHCYPWYERYNYNSEDYSIMHVFHVNIVGGYYLGSFMASFADTYSIIVSWDSDDSYSYWDYAYKFVSVSELAVFWRVPYSGMQNEAIPTYLRVMNVSDFSPVSNSEISIHYIYSDFYEDIMVNETLIFEGITDEDGFLYFSFETPTNTFSESYYSYSNLKVTAVKGSAEVTQTSYYSTYSYNMYEKGYDFIVTTDKPIYLPGENIKGRVLVFRQSFNNVTKEPAINTELLIKFTTPSRVDIFSKYLTTDENGVSTFSFEIDEDAEIGDYYFEFSIGEAEFTKMITIDRYEKPAFRVNIDSLEYASIDSYYEATIQAEYYFGKPVVNGEVKIEIFSTEVLYAEYYFYDSGQYVESEYHESELIGNFNGVTNSKGEFSFNFKVPSEYNERPYYKRYFTVFVEVIDPAERIVEANKKISTNDDLYLWAYNYPYLPELGEPFWISYWAYDEVMPSIDGAQLVIKITGSDSWKTTLLREREIILSGSSYGRELFTITKEEAEIYVSFEVELTLETIDGRHNEYTYELEFTKVELTIDLPSGEIFSGDTLIFTLRWNSRYLFSSIWEPEVYLYLYDSDYDRIATYEGTIPRTRSFGIQLNEFAPSGDYKIVAYIVQRTLTGYRVYYGSIDRQFTVNSLSSLSIESPKLTYNIGETITITGSIEGTVNSPITLEIVKRGIVGVFSIDEGSFSITFAASANLAPRIFIFAFAIDSSGKVLESFMVIDIDLTINVIVETNKNVYEPGETATVDIKFEDDYGNALSGLTCISFIDSSVFGVKPDLEEEVEHFDSINYWPIVRTITTWKTQRQHWFWYYWDVYDIWPIYYGINGIRDNGGYYEEIQSLDAGSKDGSSPPDAPDQEVDIRDNLPESMYWMPSIVGDTISLEIILPDNIGEWTIRILFTSDSGLGSLTKQTFFTRLPFFVEMEKPATSLQDDIIKVKGIVYNYKDYPVMANVSIDVDGLITLNRPWQYILIPSNYLAYVTWNVYASDSGMFNTTIIAKTIEVEPSSDGLRKQLYVAPNGVELENQEGGIVIDEKTYLFNVLPESIKTEASLVISPGNDKLVLSSWERLVGYPYGCIEQTLSKLVPTVLVLKYLNQTGELTSNLRNSLESMVISGLTRIASMQHNDGGWGWWYDDGSKVYMTSYVLYGLSFVDDWFDISNSDMIENGIDYLFDNKAGDYWVANYWWPIDTQSYNAFVIRGITSFYDVLSNTEKSLLEQTIDWFIDEWTSLNYAASLFMIAMMEESYPQALVDTTFLEELEDHLKTSYTVDESNIFWTDINDPNYRYYALGGDVETTALAIEALAVYDLNSNFNVIYDGVNWILDKQRRWGWGNTFRTASAIQAITEISKLNSGDINDTVNVYVNGDIIKTIEFNSDNQSSLVIHNIELDELMVIGNNNITIERISTNSTSYISTYFRSSQILRELLTYSLDNITVSPGEEFTQNLTLITSSDNVLARDISIEALDSNIFGENTANYSFISNTVSSLFTYDAPSEIGTYYYEGFDIVYRLVDENNTIVSPGLIHLVIDSFEVEVKEAITLRYKFNSIDSPKVSLEQVNLEVNTEKDISIVQDVNSPAKIVKGSSITISITISNNEPEVQRLLLLEGRIPAGTEFDASTDLPSFVTSYKVNYNTIEFYITEIADHQTLEFEYKLNAISVFSSSVPSISLSSMYDDWVILSNADIIGSSSLKMSQNGQLLRDEISPELLGINYEQIGKELSFAIEANDENGIESVSVLFEDEGWYELQLSPEDNNIWKGSYDSLSLSSEKMQVIVMATDTYGNVIYIDEPMFIKLTIPPEIIPIVFITIFLVMTVLITTGITVIAKNKIEKEY